MKIFDLNEKIVFSPWKQAITSVAQGVTAAYYAYQYLMNSKKRVMKTC